MAKKMLIRRKVIVYLKEMCFHLNNSLKDDKTM
jgi:hypothetical protein